MRLHNCHPHYIPCCTNIALHGQQQSRAAPVEYMQSNKHINSAHCSWQAVAKPLTHTVHTHTLSKPLASLSSLPLRLLRAGPLNTQAAAGTCGFGHVHTRPGAGKAAPWGFDLQAKANSTLAAVQPVSALRLQRAGRFNTQAAAACRLPRGQVHHLDSRGQGCPL